MERSALWRLPFWFPRLDSCLGLAIGLIKAIKKCLKVLFNILRDQPSAPPLLAARQHRKLNEELSEAELQLDTGEGIPTVDVFVDLKQRYGV